MALHPVICGANVKNRYILAVMERTIWTVSGILAILEAAFYLVLYERDHGRTRTCFQISMTVAKDRTCLLSYFGMAALLHFGPMGIWCSLMRQIYHSGHGVLFCRILFTGPPASFCAIVFMFGLRDPCDVSLTLLAVSMHETLSTAI